MNRARIRIDAESFTSKIAPALELVALRCVNRKPAQFLKIIAGEVLFNIRVLHHHVVALTELTIQLTARMNVLEQQECILHFIVGARICELTFRIVRNNGPANWVVVIAH
jgi:hypothetical protein